jgi:GNAT superfamily N-acetyltransferase
MRVTVRPATVADAAELARLRWEFRPQDQQASGLDEFSREFTDWLAQAFDSDMWIAAVADTGDHELVGCIFIEAVSKVPNPGAIHRTWGYVTNSYVAPGYRGQGVGGRLPDVVIGAARERGHEFLIVWPSEEALSFYTRAGFREVAAVHAGPDDYPPLELVLGPVPL